MEVGVLRGDASALPEWVAGWTRPVWCTVGGGLASV